MPVLGFYIGFLLAVTGPESASPPLSEAVVSDAVSVTVPAGTWRVAGQEVQVAKGTRFFVRGAGYHAVTNEPLQLSAEPPGGFWGGTELKGPATHGSINALDSLLAETLAVRAAPGGAPLSLGGDYLLSAPFAQLGLGTNTALTAADVVYASYGHRVQRLDSVVLNAAGGVDYVQGTAGTSSIRPPELPTGGVRLFNVFRPFGADALEPGHLFFIESDGALVETGTTPGRIPKTLQKLGNGEPATIVCWGDSVTVGADIADRSLSYVEQFRAALGERFPAAQIDLHNVSIGGTKSIQWLYDGDYPRFPKVDAAQCDFDRILALQPDLVALEFVNDTALTAEELEWAYGQVLGQLEAAGAEVLLITPHFTHPKVMGQAGALRPVENRPYVAFLRALAAAEGVALADASARWEQSWKEGDPAITMLANLYNHPDAKGSRFFVQELMKCFE